MNKKDGMQGWKQVLCIKLCCIASVNLEKKLYFVAQSYKIVFNMELPKDPMMLFSVINMKLRDNYSSLDELCDDLNVEERGHY